MPTSSHQAVLLFLCRLFHDHVSALGGVAMVSPLRIREGKFHEPDILILRDRADLRHQDRHWLGADVVVEVASPDNPSRDWIDKREDHAEAGIPEYWIADPRTKTITVFALQGGAFVEQGRYSRSATAASQMLPGLVVDVGEAFAAADR